MAIGLSTDGQSGYGERRMGDVLSGIITLLMQGLEASRATARHPFTRRGGGCVGGTRYRAGWIDRQRNVNEARYLINRWKYADE
jgi:hypothetical protein